MYSFKMEVYPSKKQLFLSAFGGQNGEQSVATMHTLKYPSKKTPFAGLRTRNKGEAFASGWAYTRTLRYMYYMMYSTTTTTIQVVHVHVLDSKDHKARHATVADLQAVSYYFLTFL